MNRLENQENLMKLHREQMYQRSIQQGSPGVIPMSLSNNQKKNAILYLNSITQPIYLVDLCNKVKASEFAVGEFLFNHQEYESLIIYNLNGRRKSEANE